VASIFLKTRSEGKTIFTIGNGGSGSTASHMVCDIIKGCSYNKDMRFKIICLNDNIPTLLAYSNDVSYEVVFLEQLKNLAEEGDVLLAISGSGNSKNIIRAVEYAKSIKMTVVGFTGYDGGRLKTLSDVTIDSSINDMQISEDIHSVAMHILYKLLVNV
jgi:D-sedoheptulose 7-phosphate isomerase